MTILVLWIDLPRSISIKFAAFGQNVDTEIKPLVINIQGTSFRYFKEFKTIFDPDNIFNPHIKVTSNWKFSMSHIRSHF